MSFTYYVGMGTGGTDLGSNAPTAAGTYTVVAHYAGSADYAAADSLPTSFAIMPQAIVVTANAQTKVYGTADPALTYQITSGSLETGDSFSGSLTRVLGQNVGSYAIERGTLTAGNNYDLTFVGAILLITPAPLTVTANNQTMTYGGTVPALAYTYTGLVNGDSQRQRSPAAWRPRPPRRRASRRLRDHPGNSGRDRQLHDRHVQRRHADGQPGLADRDRLQRVDDLRRHRAGPGLHLHRSGQQRRQRQLHRRPGDHGHVVEQRRRLLDHQGNSGRDRQLHDRHVQRRHADGERGNADRDRHQRVDDLRRHRAGLGLHLHRPGQRQHQRQLHRRPGDHRHVVEQRRRLLDHQGTLAATGNYTIGTFNAGTLTVNAASLTVTASNESMTYGGAVPALTYTYTGLVNGNTSASFTGGLATTATSSSNVGGYAITRELWPRPATTRSALSTQAR